MKSTGIVICNYNKREYILSCIQSVLESNTDDYDLYVVDNASTDDSVAQIQAKYKDQVTLLINKENLGGSGGFNTGILEVLKKNYKYVWCLDNDTLVDENALTALQTFLDEHPETGMVGSRIYHMENSDLIQQNGLYIDYEHFCISSPYLNRVEDGTIPEIVYSDAVAACSVLVRASLIREIGPMPEENFLYWDDIEWGYRCNHAGYKVASCGSSKVLHAMGAKKESVNTFPTYYAWRNWINFFLRHTPEEKLEAMTTTFLRSLFDIIYSDLYHGNDKRTKTVMYAYDDAIHQHLGKADSNKYFELNPNHEKLQDLVAGKQIIQLEVNNLPGFANSLTSLIQELNPTATIEQIDQGASTEALLHTKDIVTISLCENIFLLDDLSLQRCYIDLDENILLTQEDALSVINYNYSRRSFIFAQQPLFLHQIHEIRKKL